MKAHLSGLERDASRVERDALADKYKRGSVRCAALVVPAHQVRLSTDNGANKGEEESRDLQLEELCGLLRALGYREEGALG